MNEYATQEEIVSLELSLKERRHKSRDRLGYHVYLSNFFTIFKSIQSTNNHKKNSSSKNKIHLIK